MRWIAAAVTAVFAAGFASPSELAAIDRPCQAALSLAVAHKLKARIVGSDSVLPEANDGGGAWRSFKSDEDLKAYAEKENAPSTQAWLWEAPDGTTIVQMYFASDSGDWSDDVDYCFRPDGSLARVVAVLVNYSADTDGRRDIYFSPAGAVLARREQSFDQRTHKKLRREHTGNVVPIYPTVASLPFVAAAARPRTSKGR